MIILLFLFNIMSTGLYLEFLNVYKINEFEQEYK